MISGQRKLTRLFLTSGDSWICDALRLNSATRCEIIFCCSICTYCAGAGYAGGILLCHLRPNHLFCRSKGGEIIPTALGSSSLCDSNICHLWHNRPSVPISRFSHGGFSHSRRSKGHESIESRENYSGDWHRDSNDRILPFLCICCALSFYFFAHLHKHRCGLVWVGWNSQQSISSSQKPSLATSTPCCQHCFGFDLGKTLPEPCEAFCPSFISCFKTVTDTDNPTKVRTIYRLINFLEGPQGYLNTHEWSLYVFDALAMLPSMAIFVYWHPGKCLPHLGWRLPAHAR